MSGDIRLRLEGFNGDNILLGIKGNSKYTGRYLVFPPKDFVEFLKFLKGTGARLDFLMEVSNDTIIEAHKKFLK